MASKQKPVEWTNVKLRLGQLKPWIRNPRKIDSAHAERLSGSLSKFGQVDIFAVGPEYQVYNGHQRLSVLLKEKGEEYLVDCRQASRALTEKERRELTALLHAGAQGQWDWDMLKDWGKKELEAFGMDQVVLKDMSADLRGLGSILNDEELPEIRDPGVDISLADQLLKKWKVRKGDIWKCGDHTLLCGDCTDPAMLATAQKYGLAHLSFDDPPWNVDYGGAAHPSWRSRSIENDNLGADFGPFCDLFMQSIKSLTLPGAVLYLKMSAQEWPVIDRSIRSAGFHWSSTIIWVKDRMVLSRKDYHTQYEPLWYGWKDDAPRLKRLYDRTQADTWDMPTPPSNSLKKIYRIVKQKIRSIGYRRQLSSQSDVWNFARPSKSDEHPTMTPVPLIARCIINSSRPGNTVLDLFLGSGSSLIACEGTGRVLLGVELDPKYIACSLERWTVMTGHKPEKIGMI